MMTQPLISCLMVTKNRARLAQRAIFCFTKQTWANKELVIVDDGEEDYSAIVEPYLKSFTIRYHKIKNDGDLFLGGLRNISLDSAEGDYCVQWDDDEWYHPTRIDVQMEFMRSRQLDAIVLKWALMHIDDKTFINHPYRIKFRRGIPGSLLHKKSKVRYPNIKKSEDSIYLRDMAKAMNLGTMDGDHSHLFIRCFHGNNTWDGDHFNERLKYYLDDKFFYFMAKYVYRDIFRHRAFRLGEKEKESIKDFIQYSRKLQIITD